MYNSDDDRIEAIEKRLDALEGKAFVPLHLETLDVLNDALTQISHLSDMFRSMPSSDHVMMRIKTHMDKLKDSGLLE
jgi:hypothetical protein